MRRSLKALLSVALVGVTLTGCQSQKTQVNPASIKPSDNFNDSGFPIVKQPVTINVFAIQDALDGPYKDMLMFNQYEKMTKIHVNWDNIPQDGAAEKENLVFASNNLPDVFFKARITPLDIIKHGTSGTFIPLEGLIEKYAPNIQKLFTEYPEVKQSLTAPDGHIYALSDVVTLLAARTDKMWLNKTKLNAVNMEVPTTSDQLYTVLKAFQQKYPSDIPLSARTIDQLTNALGGAWGLQNQMGYNINVDGGKVHIWTADQKYEQLLMYLHKLYQENLLDHTIFTQTNAQYVAKMQSGNVGFFFNQATDAFQTKADQYIGIAPLKGPEGEQLYNAGSITRSMGAFAITSKDKYPAETMRWIDYFYGDQGSIFFRYGIEGQTFHYDQNGLPQYNDNIVNDPRGAAAIGAFTPWPGGASPEWINDKNSSAINPSQVQDAANKLKPYIPKVVYPAPLFDANTTTKLNDLKQSVDTFVQEESAKFITGDLNFNTWNQYVSQLNQMGLDQIQKIYQDAYDRTYKK